MTTIALHQPPRQMSLARQQLRTVGVQFRRSALVLLIGLVLIGAIVLASALSDASHRTTAFGFPLDPGEMLPLCFIAVLAAAALWQRDEPSRRGYHLAMPVQRDQHTLMRVFAGWCWLMVGVVGYLVLLLVMGAGVAAIGGGRITGHFPLWLWIEPFASATMCYLLASIPLIASEKPLLWLLGPPAIIATLLSMPGLYHMHGAMQTVQWLLQSPFSPNAPFYPVFYSPGADFRHARTLDVRLGVLATIFWTAVALTGVWLASRRTPNATK